MICKQISRKDTVLSLHFCWKLGASHTSTVTSISPLLVLLGWDEKGLAMRRNPCINSHAAGGSQDELVVPVWCTSLNSGDSFPFCAALSGPMDATLPGALRSGSGVSEMSGIYPGSDTSVSLLLVRANLASQAPLGHQWQKHPDIRARQAVLDNMCVKFTVG